MLRLRLCPSDTLQGREKAPDIVNNIEVLYRNQGWLAEANAMFEYVMKDQDRK